MLAEEWFTNTLYCKLREEETEPQTVVDLTIYVLLLWDILSFPERTLFPCTSHQNTNQHLHNTHRIKTHTFKLFTVETWIFIFILLFATFLARFYWKYFRSLNFINSGTAPIEIYHQVGLTIQSIQVFRLKLINNMWYKYS